MPPAKDYYLLPPKQDKTQIVSGGIKPQVQELKVTCSHTEQIQHRFSTENQIPRATTPAEPAGCWAQIHTRVSIDDGTFC